MSRPLRWRAPETVTVVVTPRWETGTEVDGALRALCGVLARRHQVEVLALTGPGRARHRDGALHVVDLTADPPESATAALASEALAAAAAASGHHPSWLPEPASTVLGWHPLPAWDQAASQIAARPPALVVLAGSLGPGAVELVAGLPSGTRTVSLPLADHRRPLDADTGALAQVVDAVLATSPADDAWLRRYGVAHPLDIGTHLPSNPYAVREPPAMVAADGYVVVVDAADAVGDSALAHDHAQSYEGAAMATAGWLAGALHPFPVAAVGGADLVVWDRRGRCERHTVVTSRSDLWRILAFARAVVAVEPDGHLARSTLEAMVHGTAVVAPAGTLAAEHVAQSSGGLVVADDAERLEAARALVDDSRSANVLGRAAQEWAVPRFGDIDGFSRRVAASCGVDAGV